MKRAKKTKHDAGGIIVGHLRAQGTSDEGLWLYALADVRDRASKTAMRWLIEAGIECPRELRHDFSDAVGEVGLYQQRKRRPVAHNWFEHELVRLDWQRFCADWSQDNPDIEPPVGKWIEVFRSQIRDVAVGAGQPAPDDAALAKMAPERTLRRLIIDELEGLT